MHKNKWAGQHPGQEGPRNCSGSKTEFVRGSVYSAEISLEPCS